MQPFTIGIDLGGTRIKIGLVRNGTVIDRKIIPAHADHGLQRCLPQLRSEIETLLQANSIQRHELAGVGLAFPGLVNSRTKKILSTNKKYDDAPGISLEQWVREQWGLPFYIDNDARMAAVGEWKYGAAKDTDNLVVITIGTGIGTSAIIEGRLLHGKHFQAGCLGGHFTFKHNGRKCSCGNVGCVEAYGAGWSLPEMARTAPGFQQSLLRNAAPLDFMALFNAAAHQDPLAIEIRDSCLEAWVSAIVNLIHAYDPEVVVLGGGVMNNAPAIMPSLTALVTTRAWCPWGTVDLRASQLLNDAGILGVVHCLQNDGNTGPAY